MKKPEKKLNKAKKASSKTPAKNSKKSGGGKLYQSTCYANKYVSTNIPTYLHKEDRPFK